ncbi:MAG: RNA polymerase sigma factor [Planctomycetota bacterium]
MAYLIHSLSIVLLNLRQDSMFLEKQLILRFNRGDTDALRDIYARYKDDLVSLAAALLQDKNAAEDVVHDVFARLVQKQDTLRISKNLRAYLMTSAANMARQHFRKRQKEPESSLETSALDNPGKELPPVSTMAHDEQKQHLTKALSALPYEQREVILLRHYSDWKFQKIASVQNVSVNTVQGRYRYGIDKLRSLLDGEVL